MHHLHYVIAFTGRIDAMRRFYERGLDLPVRRSEPDWVEFDTAGASFALHAMDDPGRQGQLLRFTSEDLDASLAELAARGLEHEGDVVEFRGSRIAGFFDVDRNYIQIVQPAHATPSGGGPALPAVLLNVADLGAATAFYRDRFALHVARHEPGEVEFDTGATRLILRAYPLGAGELRNERQPVVLRFDVPSLEELGRELAGRGLVYTAGPAELEVGRAAELTDPDGRAVVFHCTEPGVLPELALVAAEWEDDSPSRDAMRKPVNKRAKATSRVAVKPAYKSKRRPAGKKRSAPKPPPPVSGAKRVKTKPATGRLKKSERRSAARKKTSVARASRSKPVKREAARRGRAARGRGKRSR